MGAFDDYKFHPSSLGKIMTNQPGKKDTKNVSELSETAKGHCLECWIEHRYGRRKEISSKYTEKGTAVEEDAITLYSVVTMKYHKKNSDQINNDFFIGTPDFFDGESILKADKINDIKSSWDIFTFYEVLYKPIKKDYECQLNGYMDISGASEAALIYCLVNTPEHLIEREKYYVASKMGLIDAETNPEYVAKAAQIEKNMRFDDIPMKERYIEFTLQRDNDLIQKMRDRVIICREFLNSLSNA